jgi:hypothetical protein
MTTRYQGSLTLGAILPMPALSQTYLAASVGASLPDAEARLNGLIQASLQPPPGIADLLNAIQALIGSLESLLANPLPVVSVTAIADLQALVDSLNVNAAFAADFGVLLGTPGLHYYLFEGKAADVGPDLGTILSTGLPGVGLDQELAGVVLLAADGGAVTALQTVFK